MKDYKRKILDNLIDFQKLIMIDDSDNMIFNGARNSSKTFMIAKEIEYNRPKNCVIFAPCKEMFDDIIYKINFHTDLKLINYTYNNDKEKLYKDNKAIFRFGSSVNYIDKDKYINVYWKDSDEISLDVIYDYIFFEQLLPSQTNLKTKKVFSTICCNNKDHHIEQYCPDSKVFNIDYHDMLKCDLITERTFKELELKKDIVKFKKDYAIME